MRRIHVILPIAIGSTVALATMGWRLLRTTSDGTANQPALSHAHASPASWEPGSQRVYGVDYVATGGYGMEGDAGKGSFGLTLQGTVTATVLDERDGRRNVELVLRAERLDTSQMQLGIPQDRLARALEQPISVAYDARGVISGVILPADMPPEASRLLRELASRLQVAVDVAPEWVAIAPEPAGECLVSYRRRDADHIEARKERFVRVVRGSELVDAAATDGVPAFTRSIATYRVDRAGRVIDAAIEEDQRSEVAALKATAHAEVRVRFTQISAKHDRSLARAVAAEGARPLTTIASDDRDVVAKAPRVPPAELRKRIEQASATGDLNALHQAQLQLSIALAADPSGLAAVTSGSVGQPLLAAIGAAGTPAAQGALLDIGSDAARPLETRREAIDAFHQVADATEDTMAELARVAEDAPELRENALLALGALANRMRARDASGASDWVSRLVEQYQQAQSDAERIVALDALGNSGDGAALEVLEAALASGSVALQASAVQNLRLMPAPRADALLVSALAPGMDGRVRKAAMFALGFRRYDAVREPLDAIARRDPDVELRSGGLNALTTYLQRDRATDALPLIRWIAANDPDADIRDAASRALPHS